MARDSQCSPAVKHPFLNLRRMQQQQPRQVPAAHQVFIAFAAMALDRMVAIAFVWTTSLNSTFVESSTAIKFIFVTVACVTMIVKQSTGMVDAITRRYGVVRTLQLLSVCSALGLLICGLQTTMAGDIFGVALSFVLRPTEPALCMAVAMTETPVGTMMRTRYKTMARRIGTVAGVIAGSILLTSESQWMLRLFYGISGALYLSILLPLLISSKMKDYEALPRSGNEPPLALGTGLTTPSVPVEESHATVLSITAEHASARLAAEAFAAIAYEDFVLGFFLWYGDVVPGPAPLTAIAYIGVIDLVLVPKLLFLLPYEEESAKRYTYRFKVLAAVVGFFGSILLAAARSDASEQGLMVTFVVMGPVYLALAFLTDDPITEYCRVVYDPALVDSSRDAATPTPRSRLSWIFASQAIGEFFSLLVFVFCYWAGAPIRACIACLSALCYIGLTRQANKLISTFPRPNRAQNWNFPAIRLRSPTTPTATASSAEPSLAITVTPPAPRPTFSLSNGEDDDDDNPGALAGLSFEAPSAQPTPAQKESLPKSTKNTTEL